MTRALSLSKTLYSKKIQHEDNHEFPNILTVWWYKNDKLQYQLYLTHLRHLLWSQLVPKALNQSIFQPIGITRPHNFLLPKAVSQLAAKVLKILSLSAETAMHKLYDHGICIIQMAFSSRQ